MQLQKVESLGSYVFTVLDGIPSDDGYVIFTGFVYMMACKCLFVLAKIVKNCLPWPDFLAPPLLNGLRGPCITYPGTLLVYVNIFEWL